MDRPVRFHGNINAVYDIYVHLVALNMGRNAWKSATKLKGRQVMVNINDSSSFFFSLSLLLIFAFVGKRHKIASVRMDAAACISIFHCRL